VEQHIYQNFIVFLFTFEVNGIASIEATEAEASVKKSTAKIKIKYKLL
jgi:hypothetical protein